MSFRPGLRAAPRNSAAPRRARGCWTRRSTAWCSYGYNGTTTPRVAEMAGVTRGAQVHHFGSKNDLVIAALQHLAAKRAAAVVANVGDLTATDDPVGEGA